MKNFFVVILAVLSPIFTYAQVASYGISKTPSGKFRLMKTTVGDDGSESISYSGLYDSVSVAKYIAGIAIGDKLKTKMAMKYVAGAVYEIPFSDVNKILDDFSGLGITDYMYSMPEVFVNSPELDTRHSLYVSGKPVTEWDVVVNGIVTKCAVSSNGVFQEIATALNILSESPKRGSLKMYDYEFGRFTGVGTLKLVQYPVDVIKVRVIKDKDGYNKELWSSADGVVTLYKYLP